jgi:hypothetical protein
MNSGSSASTSIAVFKPDRSSNPDFVLNQPRIWLGEICGSLSIRPSRPRFTGPQSSWRRSVVKALFSSNRMKGAWGSQARYLSCPGYRVTRRRHQAATAPGQPREPHVFLDPVLVINWRDAARRSYVW